MTQKMINIAREARGLTWRYMIALVLVGLLASGAWLTLSIVISEQNNTALVVNLSGRQRMLSQRIALLANQWVQVPASNRDSIRDQLEAALNLMEETHHQLTFDGFDTKFSDTLSPAIWTMYFDGPESLNAQVQFYIKLVQELLNEPPSRLKSSPLPAKITELALNKLLQSLDAVVSQYQQEEEARILELQKLQTLLWGMILVLLVMEGLLIFWPMTRRIKEVLHQLQQNSQILLEHQDEIEQQVTEISNLNQLLEQRATEAESGNRAKSAFLATMSHEIRTPLNAIIGMAYLLSRTSLDRSQRNDIHAIESSSKNLLELINDILDFSKIEAGELNLDPHLFSLAELLHDLRAMFSAMAACKNLNLRVAEASEQIPPVLIGDGNRLRQCLINLMGNAIKFTKEGRVELAVNQVQGRSANTNHVDSEVVVRFSIKDTGIGMTEAQLAKLFVPFSQADTSTTRDFGGTGLGLSIVKRLVELMGGQIGVSSELGVGSIFWMEIPFKVSQEPVQSTLLDVNYRPLHVLVAEDNVNDRQLFVRLCSHFGWDVEAVDNGQAMVDLVLQRLEQGQPIDCVVLDWQMPGLDGLASLAQLKQKIDGHLMPSVVMVTAEDKNEFMSAIQQEKPDSILIKPIEASTLFNVVNEVVIAHGRDLDHVLNASLIKNDHSQWLPDVRVLVVDDSNLNLDVIGRLLQKEGARPTLSNSGEKALDILRSSAEPFDAVLMDLQMPGMDGCETTIHLRQELDAQIPVIALTAGATSTEQNRAMESGMDDFLIKPVEPSRLIRTLRIHIERCMNRTLPIISMKLPDSGRVDEKKSLDWPVIEGIDAEQAAKVVDFELDFFKELLELFLTENRDAAKEAKALAETHDFSQICRLMHKLRGQAGNIGALHLRATAKALEDAIQQQDSNINGKLDDLVTAHQNLVRAIEAWLEMNGV